MLRSPSTDYTDVASKLLKDKIESSWNPNGKNRDNITLLISHRAHTATNQIETLSNIFVHKAREEYYIKFKV